MIEKKIKCKTHRGRRVVVFTSMFWQIVSISVFYIQYGTLSGPDDVWKSYRKETGMSCFTLLI